ncbi:Insulin-like receptor-like 3 [Homarus americanus]|uniref:Insulin-like receptor-like 3 n=1 Tax=Homarus americanus TaxID=6706 RepID=A0A8J5THJ1_HOMAM|nr:Insulin-like receptor-like 3 [Homarus americanus]
MVRKVLQMAVEAADGMAYLAGQQLVHRDLAARNCLLDHNLSLKIGDFGLSRNLYNSKGSGALPMRWMAPESLQFSLYSTQSDVWSYGVLLWEMATRGDRPYGLVVEQRATPSLPRHCPTQLATLMRRAWKFDPDQRPSFIDITSFLLQIWLITLNNNNSNKIYK